MHSKPNVVNIIQRLKSVTQLEMFLDQNEGIDFDAHRLIFLVFPSRVLKLPFLPLLSRTGFNSTIKETCFQITPYLLMCLGSCAGVCRCII